MRQKLTQLSQLGTEIGTFDSARAVSFHHKPYYLTGDYTPLAVLVERFDKFSLSLPKYLGPVPSTRRSVRKAPFPRASKRQNFSKSHLFQELENTLISR